jgi:hypothetical protein
MKFYEEVLALPGVTITHDYKGGRGWWYIHCKVADDVALHGLCKLAARQNAEMHIYEYSDVEFRYTLVFRDI